MIWNFDPVLFSYGPISIHWYGVIFSLAIFSGYHLTRSMFVAEDRTPKSLDILLFFVVIGIVVGARLGHCFFYDPQYYLANPLKILAIWEGGLASHGGGLGAILAIFLYSRSYQISFIWLLDRISISTALFGSFVRFANFLNSEIVGVKSTVPWSIVFERIDNIPRHPAQLYESIGYLFTFIILLVLYKRTELKNHPGAIFALFLIMIFTIRFLVEYVKEPQASYNLGITLTTGQLLTIPFLALGLVVLFITRTCKQVS